MNKQKFAIHMALLIFTGMFASVNFAQESKSSKIIWSCKKPYTKENIVWLVEWGPKSYVKVFDERIPARYTMDGLEKRWDWGLDSEFTYNYAITLRPDRTAMYYDFSASKDGTAKSKGTYKCKK